VHTIKSHIALAQPGSPMVVQEVIEYLKITDNGQSLAQRVVGIIETDDIQKAKEQTLVAPDSSVLKEQTLAPDQSLLKEQPSGPISSVLKQQTTAPD
jgi:hypothetical protein